MKINKKLLKQAESVKIKPNGIIYAFYKDIASILNVQSKKKTISICYRENVKWATKNRQLAYGSNRYNVYDEKKEYMANGETK